MTLLLCLLIGTLAGSGLYLMLRARIFDLILGLGLLSYAVNLFIFAMGRLRAGAVPIVSAAESAAQTASLSQHTDPLPQALVLTAIVIGFAMTAVLLVIALRAGAASGTDQVDGRSDEAAR